MHERRRRHIFAWYTAVSNIRTYTVFKTCCFANVEAFVVRFFVALSVLLQPDVLISVTADVIDVQATQNALINIQNVTVVIAFFS